MQGKGSNGSAALLVRQQHMTLPEISKRLMLWLMTKNQLSVTVLLTPALVWREGKVSPFQVGERDALQTGSDRVQLSSCIA